MKDDALAPTEAELFAQGRHAERWRCHEVALVALRARRPELTAGLIASGIGAGDAAAQMAELPKMPRPMVAADTLLDAREAMLHGGLVPPLP